jgi:hypothetical protein
VPVLVLVPVLDPLPVLAPPAPDDADDPEDGLDDEDEALLSPLLLQPTLQPTATASAPRSAVTASWRGMEVRETLGEILECVTRARRRKHACRAPRDAQRPCA